MIPYSLTLSDNLFPIVSCFTFDCGLICDSAHAHVDAHDHDHDRGCGRVYGRGDCHDDDDHDFILSLRIFIPPNESEPLQTHGEVDQ